jgi:phosphatidylserine decarboxylase
VRYIAGDTWNVNPITLRRIERLFCRNERVVLDVTLGRSQAALTLVPVAAVLVASLALAGLPVTLDPDYAGPTTLAWNRTFAKGDELGHFQHGSTILVFATGGFVFAPGIREGTVLRMGQPLLRHPLHRFSADPLAEVA